MKKNRLLCAATRAVERFYYLVPAVLALLMYLLLPLSPEFTEYVHSRGLFRLVSVPLGFLVALVPLSFSELAVVAAIPLALLSLVLFIRRIVRQRGRRKAVLAHGLKNTAMFLSSLLFIYMFMHGANFYRLTAAELLQLESAPRDAEFLQAVCIDLAKKASAERESLPEDENGNMVLPDGLYAALAQADGGYGPLSREYPFLWGSVWQAKRVFLSYFWSYTGISGMYFPWFCEANVNTDQPHSAIPATAAHEIAHTRGFAREDECNFFAYLSCSYHPEAAYRYSGYLLAFIYCQNELLAIDSELWNEARSYCSEAVIRDLEQRNAYWARFEGPVSEASSNANNAFIQGQGVEDGVRSYGRVTELVLSWYAEKGLV